MHGRWDVEDCRQAHLLPIHMVVEVFRLDVRMFFVVDLGNGNYEAKHPSSTRFLAFRVSP